MSENINLISKEENPANKGILVSAIIIIAGLFPTIETNFLKIYIKIYIPIDSWLLILAGVSLLFYFISMKVNQNEYMDNNNNNNNNAKIVYITTPVHRSKLSQECLGISIISFILFILRGGYILLINVIPRL